MTRLMLCCSVLLLCACQSSHQQPQIAAETVPGKPGELPVKAFAALPLVQQLSLSPDGNFVAFLQTPMAIPRLSPKTAVAKTCMWC